MICNRCGTENSENARFCRECGKAFVTSEIKEKRQPISVKLWVDILIVVVMCGAVTLAALFQHKDYWYIKIQNSSIVEELKPDYIKVAEKYAKVIARNDYKGLIELFPIEPFGSLGELLEGVLLAEYEGNSDERYEIVDQDVVCSVIGVKDRTGEELTNLQNQYMENWDTEISDSKKIKMKVRYAGGTEENFLDASLIEIQGKWYVDIENIEDMD